MAASPVLDSYALLAFLRGEPGEEKVHMTEANYAEVKYITVRKDGATRWEEIARELRAFPIEFHPIDRALADLAAVFKARHKLSLADAFAAALAKERKCELVTGDPEFAAIEKEIKIVWLL
jgi:predicted nucleic acid-binding protein